MCCHSVLSVIVPTDVRGTSGSVFLHSKLLCVAIASYQSLYPLMLVVPVALYFYIVSCVCCHSVLSVIVPTDVSGASGSVFLHSKLCVAIASYQSLYPLMLVVPVALYFYIVSCVCCHSVLSVIVPTDVSGPSGSVFLHSKLCVAIASYQSLYPLMLVVPVALYFYIVSCVCCHSVLSVIVPTDVSGASGSVFLHSKLCVAIASYQSLYPLMLVVPVALYFYMVSCCVLP